MKKFKVTVTRTDEYFIEIDEKIYTDPQWRKDFEKSFWPIRSLNTIVENLAFHQMRNGNESFMEGYGYITRDGKLPYSREDYDKHLNKLPEDKRRQAALGLNIIIDTEDDDYDFQITEIITTPS